MKSIKQSMPAWVAAVALGAAVASAVPAVAQVPLNDPAAAAQRAQQQKENEERANRESKQQQQQSKQERQQLKQEREQLGNMPAGAKRLLRTETEGATNIDYFKIPGKGGERNQFGATFTKADGHNYDIRVDRDGNVISRTDLTAQAQAAAQPPAAPAPAQPAPAQPAPTPTPPTAQAPAQPAPTPAPAPAPTAADDKTYRRLQLNDIPANVRTVIDRETRGGKDLKYYRSAYGKQSSYTVTWDGTDGREHKAYFGDDGTVLARKTGDDNDDAQTAAASEKASQPGRVELAAMPKQVQSQFRKLTDGASDVKYYRTQYGKQDAFQANYKGRDGKEHKVYVDENGKILAQKDDSSKKN